ncbi:MAG: Uma2 family endonuclease [Candidatus Sumerlaeota bacterium]|nr:Uma2 family endonuclease [Candidatus Sumerlaeota bacterium]
MEAALLKEDVEPRYTYGDYVEWTGPDRWELIDGVPYAMSPAPMRKHQDISGELCVQIHTFLRGKPSKVYAAPFDVRLPDGDEPDEEIRNLAQPDIVVVCDKKKLDEKGCRGAPEFVIEILSRSSITQDTIRKVALYEKFGVKEYWIVDPDAKRITVRLSGSDGRFSPPQVHEGSGQLAVATLPGLSIDLDVVFQATL